jgi:hypothetical protein
MERAGQGDPTVLDLVLRFELRSSRRHKQAGLSMNRATEPGLLAL